MEKDGQYFDDYDLNRSNSYCYQREMKTGEYRLYARVRYDQSGDYQVEPEYLGFKKLEGRIIVKCIAQYFSSMVRSAG